MAARWWSGGDGGITVAVHVSPGARRSEVVDAAGERLRVRVAARAHDGQANAELERFLAGVFGVRPAQVSLVRGRRSRDKTVRIEGVHAPPTGLLGS